MILAQIERNAWPVIGTWMVGFIGALGIAVMTLHAINLIRQTFGHRPPLDSQVQKIVTKMEDMEEELKLDGSRRSKTLFDHIRTELGPINSRLNEHGEKIARLEERHPPRRGQH